LSHCSLLVSWVPVLLSSIDVTVPNFLTAVSNLLMSTLRQPISWGDDDCDVAELRRRIRGAGPGLGRILQGQRWWTEKSGRIWVL
jgi:hypothetical protein